MSLRNLTVTKGIVNSMPDLLQPTMWYLVTVMKAEEKDYLQIFEFSTVIKSGEIKQKIVHKQECPKYEKEYVISIDEPVELKAYIIFDNNTTTMLLAEEY